MRAALAEAAWRLTVMPVRARVWSSGLEFSARRVQRVFAHDAAWILLGLLVVVAVAWRVVATPGELIVEDREYPLAPEFWLRRITNAWDTSNGSSLQFFPRTYTDAPWGLAVQAFGLSTEVAGKFHWLSWHILGFLAGYFGARLLVGPETPTRNQVAVRVGCLLAGLFWALNPWGLVRWDHLHLRVSTVMLPLYLGLLVAATRAHTPRARAHRALAAAAILAFAVSASPHYMAIGTLSGLGWLVYAFVTARGARRLVAVTAAVFVAGYVTLAAFILIPFVVASAAGSTTEPHYLSDSREITVTKPFQSMSNVFTLTGHQSGGWDLRPSDADALPGWRMAGLVPAALLAFALWRVPDHRRVLGYGALLAGLTALLQIAAYAEATHPAYRALATNAPFGWAIKNQDMLTGALALAYLPGIALAPTAFIRAVPRGRLIVGSVQTAALGVALAVYMWPAIDWALLDEKGRIVPERFPASFYSVPAEIDRRNASGATRTYLAGWEHRYPDWSANNRILQDIEGLAVTTPYTGRFLPTGSYLASLLEGDTSNLVDALRARGVARVLVPTGTPRGRDLVQRLHRTTGMELDFAEDYHEVFRTVDPPYPWVYEQRPAGPTGLPWRREGMHRLVIDVPPGLDEPREIVTQEYWDPLWTAQLPGHEAAVERSELGLLSVRLGPGASGPLVLEYGLQRALIVGHAISWAGLLAWAVWSVWPKLPWRPRAYP